MTPRRSENVNRVEIAFDCPGWNDCQISDQSVRVPVEAALNRLVSVPGQAGMTILLTDDARLKELNAGFRGRDLATNVLSFPSGDEDYIGDIALAFETVVREAAEQGISVTDHTSHLVVHGTLHLMGFDHQTNEDAQTMEQLEVTILKDLGIDNPYRDAGETIPSSEACRP